MISRLSGGNNLKSIFLLILSLFVLRSVSGSMESPCIQIFIFHSGAQMGVVLHYVNFFVENVSDCIMT